MHTDLPGPVAAYFNATNQHDIDARLAAFDEHARVKDESQEYHGRRAIRSWMEESARKYHFTVEVKEVMHVNDETVVSGLVSGDFPGSPVLLRHAFTLSGASISDLEIDA